MRNACHHSYAQHKHLFGDDRNIIIKSTFFWLEVLLLCVQEPIPRDMLCMNDDVLAPWNHV